MKNKSGLMVLLKLIFTLLVIILILLVMFLYKSIVGNNKHQKITYKTIEKTYNIEKIENLTFDFKNYEVKYILTKKDEMIVKQTGKVNKLYIDNIKNGKKMTIKESVTNIFDKKTYRIYIPMSYEGKIKIINGFNNINIKKLNEISLDNNAGNVKINGVKNIKIKNVSGNIYINGQTEVISGSSTTGNISIDELNKSCNLETITGDITIKNFNISSASNIETTSGNIVLKIDRKSDCSLKYTNNDMYQITEKKCNGGKNELKLKNVTGNIIIR